MRSTFSLAVGSVCLALAAACGGSVDVADGAGGSGEDGTSGVGTTATTGTTATATGGTGSVSTGSAGDGGSGGSGDGGVMTSGGGSSEGGSIGQGGSSEGGGSGDGGFGEGGSVGQGGAGGSGIEPFLCGEVECADDEQCCGSQGGVNCVGADEPCQGPVLTCQSAANCEGDQICCLEGGFQDAHSVCADACEAGPGGPLQLCETADECPPDVACMEVFGGFKVCTNGFPGMP